MSVSVFRLSKASHAEREVLAAMRALCHGTQPRAELSIRARKSLDSLVAKARRNRYAIWASDAPNVSADELKLLGWLALFQREQPDPLISLDQSLLIELRRAAEDLKAAFRLPYQAVQRAGFVAAASHQAHASSPDKYPMALNHAYPPRRPRPNRPGTVGDRAVAYARSRGQVSSKELCSIGISREYLRILCLKGRLIRVHHGCYEAAPREQVTDLQKRFADRVAGLPDHPATAHPTPSRLPSHRLVATAGSQ